MPGITRYLGRAKRSRLRRRAKKMSQHFCYLAPFKKHLNFGFMYGAHLPDPKGLLEGKGADLRHVKIRRAEDLERPALRNLVECASRYLPKLQ